MDKEDLAVEIPANWLLILAAHGSMGDGEIPRIMQIWAQRKCLDNGLSEELKEFQEKRKAILLERLKNVTFKASS